jgi:signal transduction histidine kinase
MPNGGAFTIDTESIEFNGPALTHGVATMHHVRWVMEDTGTGMDEETRKRAFEPFFTTKPSGVGTGLGLSMVSAVIERAGGDVALESAPGQGTSLVIRLPRATGYARTPSPSSAPPPDVTPLDREGRRT